MPKWLRAARYRMGQVRQQLGAAPPLTSEEDAEVARWLAPPALALFKTMSSADQRHSLRVCQGLQRRGCSEEDMLAAALLHDVGKAQGRVPFWTRPAIVLGKRLAPGLLPRLVDLDARATAPPTFRRALSNAWHHAEVGAQLAYAAGLSERAVLYIRTHHQADGPAAELHKVDEVS
jgi:putative nucleotidyltransferase with HDIG domain